VRAVDVAVLEDSQRGEQLAARPLLAPAFEAQCRQRIDGGDVAVVAAVVALDAPDCDHDAGRHAVARRRSVGFAAKLQQLALALRDALGRHRAVEIVPDRAGELGLGTIQFDDSRQVVDVVERGAQRWLVNACGAGSGAKAHDPARKTLLGRNFISPGVCRLGADG